MLLFLSWFIDREHIGYAPVFLLLTFALFFKLAKMVHEWYHYWSPSVPERPTVTKQWTVDVLTTSCPGEPRDMIIRTLYAMKGITYPHTNYLCDEGNDPELKKICEELGIVHVTRTVKVDAKAGNINNALKQATGELCVVLDPDHVPIPQFLDRVIPYFEQHDIGYVQCVQAYGNQDESFIARGAAEQTYHFYGPMMMCMNTYGTVQAIGANCTFRRTALDSIGGHAAGLAEDMHTAMQLHAKGWKSVYVPEILSRGLVPATLSAYYKQQLKWSRGTFELLFRTFPHLCKNFTWRQKLHYFCIPIYFLFGLINLIDIAIPVVALGLAQVPWEVNMGQFGLYFLPMCLFSMMIRLYSQRWLLEKHERGFHLAGGILRTATWWVFLVGFVYSIFNIKVPYIPTPKEDEHQNFIKLSVPNIIVLVVCGFFIVYGLYIDWTPYSIAMAFYSLITAGILGFTVLMSQQKLIMQAQNYCIKMPFINGVRNFIGSIIQRFQQYAYGLVRNSVIVLMIALSLIFVSSVSILEDENERSVYKPKEFGGFYLGKHAGSSEDINNNVTSFIQKWGEVPAADLFNQETGIPYITISTHVLPQEIKNNLYREICKGNYDTFLKEYASDLRNYKHPVFMTFEALPGDQFTGEQFQKAWQYVYTFFNNLGISNVTWVWCPLSDKNEDHYPGEKFVDWIGVSCLNYADNAKAKDWYLFSGLYEPYRKAYGKFKKPVMITNLGTVLGSSQSYWFSDALKSISAKYKEIRSVIFYSEEKTITTVFGTDTFLTRCDFSVRSKTTLSSIKEQLRNENYSRSDFSNVSGPSQMIYHSAFVMGKPGKFQLMINNRPYYIRGVAYNTAHDWRDGHMPLSRRQVEKDFEKIKEMGANTIRRYGHGIYDRNVLNIAEEYDLNVLYGFWFDPKIDFYKDSAKVLAYMNEMESKVLKYKDHSAIIAWSLGNESWGLLKHSFAKPYLTKVRNAYVQMIERMAQRIHELDPSRPVFSCIEHEEYQLPGELVAFHDGAPSIDVIGINSYYKEQISTLNHVAWQFDSLRPYLVSEFGPRGYWDPKYNDQKNNTVLEESDQEKSDWYRYQWEKYVQGYKGFNIGGFAYCWHDRMEGSFTWFGLTDYKGRLKPSYFALKEEWTKKKGRSLPEYKITTRENLIPGKTYFFTADGKSNEDLDYEWRLLKDDDFDKVDVIEKFDDPQLVKITIPEEPADYRLYLFVTDKEEYRVTTASLPIKVLERKAR